VFLIEVRLENGATSQASAGNKRQAEQAAAVALLEQVTKG
jgi:ribonuclease-3